jgi:hypothetical protein
MGAQRPQFPVKIAGPPASLCNSAPRRRGRRTPRRADLWEGLDNLRGCRWDTVVIELENS